MTPALSREDEPMGPAKGGSDLIAALDAMKPSYEQATYIADSPSYAPCGAAVATAYTAGYWRAVENLKALVAGDGR